jgi:hypothetical protein
MGGPVTLTRLVKWVLIVIVLGIVITWIMSYTLVARPAG